MFITVLVFYSHVTDYLERSNSKQHTFIVSQFSKSEVGSEEESAFKLLQIVGRIQSLEGPYFLGAASWGPVLSPKDHPHSFLCDHPPHFRASKDIKTSICFESLCFSILDFRFYPVIWICIYVCVCSVARSYPTLCDPMDYNLRGSSAHGILQARILEWVAISSSTGSSQPKDWPRVSCISCTGRRILYHGASWGAPLSMCMCASRSVMSNTLWPHGLQPARLLCPWDSPGKNTGLSFQFLCKPSEAFNTAVTQTNLSPQLTSGDS